jgi:hypothetical protein
MRSIRIWLISADRRRYAGVRFLMPGDDGPAIVDSKQLDTIRISVEHYRVEAHAPLIAGRIGNVIRGPLSGKSGLIPPDGSVPLVFNIDILGQGLAVFLADGEVSVSDGPSATESLT